MNTELLFGILAGAIVVCAVSFAVYMWKRRKMKKKKELEIPKEILEDFEKAEKRYAEHLRNDEKVKGEQVLFELINERRSRDVRGFKDNARETNNDGRIDAGKPAVEVNDIQDPGLAERGEIQNGDVKSNDRAECAVVGNEQEHPGVEKAVRRRSIFSRIRRN